jgi:uncharacterized protein
MNSCIYNCKLWHERLKPKRNAFNYSIYLWYIDLDEINKLSELKLFSYNGNNIFSLFDKDHFKFIDQKKQIISKEKISYEPSKYKGKDLKNKIKVMVEELNLGFEPEKVFLLTNLRQFGYVFNPVSFYFCFDEKGACRAIFSEVNNTFHDQKMYFTNIKNPDSKIYKDEQRKNYYISPFIEYDSDLHWEFTIPQDDFLIKINSVKGDAILKTALRGKRRELTNSALIYLIFGYPLKNLMIIFLIHYQALKLWIKKVPFYKKESTDKEIERAIKNELDL